MPEEKENRSTKLKKGNRLYWLLAGIAFPIWAALVSPFFAIGCRCVYGSARSGVYYPLILLVWSRFAFGLALGENRKKIWVYLAMPILMGITITLISAMMGIDG